MRRIILVLLCVFLVFQVGCGGASDVSEEEMIRPVQFYYAATGEAQYDRETGALNWELHDLGKKNLTMDEILALYLKGPVSPDLESPFPARSAVQTVSLENGVLKLSVSAELAQLTGVRQVLAAACLVYTMTQFEGVDALWLDNGNGLQGCWNQVLNRDSFILLDGTDGNQQQNVTLYFANAGCRFLVSELRVSAVKTEEELPAFLVEQLLLGPQEEGGYAVLPVQTELLSIDVKDGICTVNFSADFLENKPQTHREARMAVFSVVNTLTELDDISSVRFLCSGIMVTEYVGLAMDEPLYRDETAVEVEQEEATFDATVFLPCSERQPLMAVPVRVVDIVGRASYEDLLQTLISTKPGNGYSNPIPEDAQISNITLENGICSVTFSREFARCDSDPKQAEQAVRAVVCTLCNLREVEQVKIMIRNGGLTTVDLSAPMTADLDWYMQ